MQNCSKAGHGNWIYEHDHGDNFLYCDGSKDMTEALVVTLESVEENRENGENYWLYTGCLTTSKYSNVRLSDI